jgi:hypothetical protein
MRVSAGGGQFYYGLLLIPTACQASSKSRASLVPNLTRQPLKRWKKWKFSPATQDGKPVTVEINVEVNFHVY